MPYKVATHPIAFHWPHCPRATRVDRPGPRLLAGLGSFAFCHCTRLGNAPVVTDATVMSLGTVSPHSRAEFVATIFFLISKKTSVKMSQPVTPPSSRTISVINDPTVPVTGLHVNATGWFRDGNVNVRIGWPCCCERTPVKRHRSSVLRRTNILFFNLTN